MKKKERDRLGLETVHIYLISVAIVFSILGFFANSYVGRSESGPVACDLGRESISIEEVGNKTLNYVTENFLKPQGWTGKLLGVEDKGDLYSIKLSATRQGVPAQNVTFYATKAGKLILGQDLVDLTEEISTTTTPVSIGQIKTPSMDDDAVLGSEDAPVTIIEFSDYQCPFCNRHYVQTLPQLKAEYINTGKVKLVFRDFPLTFHTEADEAAEAAECAGEQGKYWEMHDKLFESVDEWGGKSDPKDVFKNLASDIGLDSTDFNECLDSGKYTQEVQEDEQDGASLGITGTPGFFLITPKEHVNGDDLATLNQLASSRGRGIEIFEDSEEGNIIVKLGGALPFSDFKTAIDALLP